MDAETSRALFENGAMAVILDVPPGTEFGIDTNSWTTGDKFKGVKMIPPGVHLLHYSAVCRSDVAPRTSFFHFFSARELLVRVWNPGTETLDEPRDPLLRERLSANKHELDRFLAAYPSDCLMRWCSLTRHVTREALQRVQAAEPQRLRFTAVPAGARGADVAAERTRHALDGSRQLTALLETCSAAELLGELQLAFVAFLVGHELEAFEHWKLLVTVICTSDDLLHSRHQFFSTFISVFHYQIKEVPDEFFTDIVTKQNFLLYILYIFFSNLSDSGVPAALRERGARFQQYLENKFAWDFSSEPDEYAPVVVDLP